MARRPLSERSSFLTPKSTAKYSDKTSGINILEYVAETQGFLPAPIPTPSTPIVGGYFEYQGNQTYFEVINNEEYYER